MPKEAFGGDDEGGGGGEEKKLDLSKYGLSPDTNIRDVFWKIMGSYAASKKPGIDLAGKEQERFALMRVAISVLSRPHGEQYGLSSGFIVRYSLMMILDGEWQDVFIEFLEEGAEGEPEIKKKIVVSLKKLTGQEHYRELINRYISKMLRGRQSVAIALSYLAEMKNEELAESLKKELIILARGDIGQNQINAIRTISLIKNDVDVKKTFLILLSHWDAAARLEAANNLIGIKDEEVKKTAKKRLLTETNEDVKKTLKRLAR